MVKAPDIKIGDLRKYLKELQDEKKELADEDKINASCLNRVEEEIEKIEILIENEVQQKQIEAQKEAN